MALILELEEHGCNLKASPVCKFIKKEVQRCQTCEYKKMTDEQRRQIAIDYYLQQGVLEQYPITLAEDGECALCKKDVQKATVETYAKITNTIMDVRKDLMGSSEKINGGEIELIIPTCAMCRENIRKVKWNRKLMAALCIFFVVAATALINITMNADIQTGTSLIPLCVFLLCSIAGGGLYYMLVKTYVKNIGTYTRTQVFEIPALKGMEKKGWYERRKSWLSATIYPEMPEDMVDTRVTFHQMIHGKPKKNTKSMAKGR